MTASMTVPNRGQTLSSIISSVKAALGSSATLDVGVGVSEVPINAYLGALAYADNIVLTKDDIGLGSVDNTSDADKPISTDMQAALDLKVALREGYALSKNDFSDALKVKLEGITPTAYVQTWTLGALAYRDSINYDEIEGTPVIPVQVNANWQTTATDDLSYIQNKPNLAAVATSGAYADLQGKPNLAAYAEEWKLGAFAYRDALDYAEISNTPAPQVNADWNSIATDSPARILNKPSLATIATSGLYADLQGTPDLSVYARRWEMGALAYRDNIDYSEISNTPTIPAAPVQSNWNTTSTSDLSYIINKPTLGTASAKDVATSGDASATQVVLGSDSRLTNARDYTNAWALGALAFRDGVDYTELSSLPTKLSEFTNDSSFLTSTTLSITTDKLPTIPVSKLATLTTDVIPSLPTSKITGLGTAATKNIPASGDAGIAEVVLGSDSRLVKPVDSSWSFGAMAYRDTIEYSELSGQPTIPAAQVQSDWNATSTSDLAYIKNKPTLGTAASKNTGTGDGNVPLLDSLGKLSSSVIPFGITSSSVAYGNHTHTVYAAVDHSHSGYLSAVPTAADTVTGGVRTGYTESGSNYAVKLDANSKAYVNVPLASHSHTEYSSTSHSHSSFSNDLLINSLTCGRGNGNSISNVAFGYNCFTVNSGTHNIAIGNEALKDNTTGSRNTAVGSQTFGSLTATSDNTGIGYGALNGTTGTENTCVGSYAGYLTTSGGYNTVIGSKAFYTNTAGYGNTILGASAGNALISNFNVILGYKAAEFLGASDNNTIVGYNTAQNLVSGTKNTVIGSRINTGDVSNHVFIGDGGGNIRAKHDGTNWTMNGSVTASSFIISGGTATQVLMANGSTATMPSYSAGTGLTLSSGSFSVSYGTSATTACVGNDSRLSDSRNPNSHTLLSHTVSGLTTGHVLQATGASTYGFAAVPTASTTVIGGVQLGYTSTGKNYAVQLDGSSKAYVNVPWTDSDTTYSNATSAVAGLVKVHLTQFSGTVNSVSTTSGRTYPVQIMSTGEIVVNVPWSDTDTNTTYSAATTSVNGLIKLGSSSTQSATAASIGTTNGRTYLSQVNSSGQLVVNVPWTDTDTNTTYTFGTGTVNGTISVTPSGGNATNVTVKGLGSAAYTALTDYAAAGHTHTSFSSSVTFSATATFTSTLFASGGINAANITASSTTTLNGLLQCTEAATFKYKDVSMRVGNNFAEGYMCISGASSKPIGTPSVLYGGFPLYFDNYAKRLYIYDGSTWYYINTDGVRP